MAVKINNSADTATNRDKPVTFEEAEDLGAFELASRWADRLPWPLPQNRSASDDLAELAFGGSIDDTFRLWHPWAVKQRESVICGEPGVTAEEFETVARAFAHTVTRARSSRSVSSIRDR